ncbi:hypothetical protein HGRIS_006575 [Hohenbuehelia grisea]|uniref:DUF6534 domain-containing protein n=1 Tax=Hohenbuehelia grisea TaxID=104357 RepID=A0ABR3JAW3_9AGAR
MAGASLNQTLNNSIGALYVGTIVAAVLYGFTSLQTYWYYHWYARRDTKVHKISVGFLWALDTVHLILICHGVYHYMVTGFGNFFGLLGVVWSLKLQVTINVLIIFIVHCLYTYRVWLLGGYHNGFLAYFVMAVLCAGLAMGIVLAYEVYKVDSFPQHEQMSWSIIAAVATATIIDFVIAAAMCYYLRKSKGPQPHLNNRLSNLMQFVLGSGFLTSATSTSVLISYIALPDTLVFLAIESFLTKLYINSFLAMLNARESRTGREHEHELSIHISGASKHSPFSTHTTPPSFTVTTEKSVNFAADFSRAKSPASPIMEEP